MYYVCRATRHAESRTPAAEMRNSTRGSMNAHRTEYILAHLRVQSTMYSYEYVHAAIVVSSSMTGSPERLGGVRLYVIESCEKTALDPAADE